MITISTGRRRALGRTGGQGRFSPRWRCSSHALSLATATGPAHAMKIQDHQEPRRHRGLARRGAQQSAAGDAKFAFEGGNSQDPEGKDGVANFVTAMLDEGAGDLDSGEYQERMETLAMRMSYDDSRDAFYGNFETLTQNRAQSAELLKLAITKPRFDPDAVERIRGQLIANLTYSDRDPEKVAAREWFATAFAGHAYARPSSRHRGDRQGHDARRSRSLPQARVRQGQPQGRRCRRHHAGAAWASCSDEVFGDLPPKADLHPSP